MAEQRQPFHFRLPWSVAPAAPRPSQLTQAQTQPPAPRQAPAAPRPSQVTQAPSQPPESQQAPSQPRPSQVTQGKSQSPTPQQAPAAPRPSQVTQAPSQPQAQRPPFRPAGVARAQPPPPLPAPTREEPSSPSRSSQGTPKPATLPREKRPAQGPPASPSQTIPPTQVTSRPASPTQVSSKLQQATPQSSSPSRGDDKPTRTKATTAPPPTPSQTKLSSPTKKPPTLATDKTQNPKDLRKRETSKLPLDEPKPVLDTAAPPKEPKTLPTDKEPKLKPSTTLSAEVSSPKQEPKPKIVEEYNASYKEAKHMLKENHEDLKKEAVNGKNISSPKTRTIEHPLADQDGEGLHSEKEVFDIKEVFKKTENRGHDAENETRGHERVARYPHKHTNAGHKFPFKKEIKEYLPKLVHKQGAQQEKQLHEKPLSIITLTGENIGATMHLSSESINKESPIHIHRGYKLNSDEAAKTIDAEGSSRKRKSGDTNFQEDTATMSYVNNNVQGINNSLIFNSSVTERNPGVHVVFTRNHVEPQLKNTKLGKEKGKLDAHKAEVIRTPAENLAYAPRIRRRCLRGLFLESSDSDPEKPLRHGCRVGFNQKSEDGTINVL